MKTVVINCTSAAALPFASLSVFQGGLKKRTEEDFRKIRESIDKHGFIAPFFVWEDGGHNWILDGTGRAETLQDMERAGYNIPDLPVVYVKAADESEAKEILLKITSHYGKISSKGLKEFIAGLNIDFDELGLDVYIPKDFKESLGIAPKTEEAVSTLYGDEYDFCIEGETRHRLVCGNAQQKEVWAALMGEERAALVFTDPPYGIGIGQTNIDRNNALERKSSVEDDLEGDSLDLDALQKLLSSCFVNVKEYMREDASYYICSGSGYTGIIIAQALKDSGLPAKNELIWCKNSPTFSIGRLDYDYQHEKLWYGWKERHRFYGLGKFKTTLWNFNRPEKSKHHATMKPTELIENCIRDGMEPLERLQNGILNNSVKNSIVLDPFAGSGSTLVACDKLKRLAYMIEIEPKYCDVIVKRALEVNPAMEIYVTRKGVRTKYQAETGGISR
jgi:ParB family chromosome partitioning protein